MTIWVFKGPTDYEKNSLEFLSSSIKDGISRFGWSYIDTANLIKLKDKSWTEMSTEEKDCWNKANFLLGIKKGDWIVHVNLPNWGLCIAGQVIEEYSFEEVGNKLGDFRHLLKLDSKTIVEFDRNSDGVLPVISSRLKLQGRYWRIQFKEEFLESIENVRKGVKIDRAKETHGIHYLKKDMASVFMELSNKIQKTHPAHKLEGLIAEVFRHIPGIIDVNENGKHKGWGTDHGADIIVTYKSGLSIGSLEKEEKLVIQVKSYTGQHWETNAVEQIGAAIVEYEANAGMIITTAKSTPNLEKAIDDLSIKLSAKISRQIPIELIAGEDVAKFLLKHGRDLVF